jgi:hypothetical protein
MRLERKAHRKQALKRSPQQETNRPCKSASATTPAHWKHQQADFEGALLFQAVGMSLSSLPPGGVCSQCGARKGLASPQEAGADL